MGFPNRNNLAILGLSWPVILELEKQIAGLSIPPVSAGSSLSLSPFLNAGNEVALDTLTGSTVTLPAATGSGVRFKFLVTTLATSNAHVVSTVPSTDVFIGTIAGVSDDPATVKGWIAGATDNTITLNRSTTGSVSKGEWFEVQDIAAGVWSVTGMITQTGVEATPFSHV